MQFKHPEILYALLLLLIPIIVHLFQLRRFQKVDFTNVAFLKKATLQTRKSSRIKKWLTLLARLGAIACMVLAFAQPFTASKSAPNTEKETVIYLDNSFSMQAKGANGPMLPRVQQQLFDYLAGEETLSWFTNETTKRQVSQTDFKNEVLSIGYTQNQLSLPSVIQKAEQLFSQSPTAEKRLILISDFQQNGTLPSVDKDWIVDIVQTQPVLANNMAIDTAYIVSKNVNNAQLSVTVSGVGELPESTSLSLYNQDQLIAKTAVDLSQNLQGTVVFDLENPSGFEGTLRITDSYLSFDNALYFSIRKDEKIKVLSINQGDATFLQKLFDNETYDYHQESHNTLNYSIIPDYHFIVLNELSTLPASLATALQAFQESGGSLCIIPSQNADIDSYNTLLNALQIGVLGNAISVQEKKITQINFSHPLYQNVFEKEVTNFQYPSVKGFFNVQSNASKVLEFEDGRPFLLQSGKNYLATAAFGSENSNFKNSPLIVPTLINMAQQSLPLPKLYYEMGRPNTFAIPVTLGPDEILSLRDSITSFIPLQQTRAKSVEITTIEEPSVAGNYSVVHGDEALQTVSFNYSREESRLSYVDVKDWEGATVYHSVSSLFDSIAEANNLNQLWKWFVIFAVLFLLFEMFILKFFK